VGSSASDPHSAVGAAGDTEVVVGVSIAGAGAAAYVISGVTSGVASGVASGVGAILGLSIALFRSFVLTQGMGGAFVETLATHLNGDGTYSHSNFVVLRGEEGRAFFMRCKEPDKEVIRKSVVQMLEVIKKKEEANLAVPEPGQVGGNALEIDWTQAFPKLDPVSTRAPADLGKYVLVKRMFLLNYGDSEEYQKKQQNLLSEARVYKMMRASNEAGELIGKDGYGNIVKYYGCFITQHDGIDYIAGLALDLQEQDLMSRCEEPHIPLDVGRVVKEVQQELKFLHGLGYCHNNVEPHNIVLTEDDKAMLIDFDACLPDGVPLRKWPLLGYIDSEKTMSRKKNDWYGLSKVEEKLRSVLRGSA